MKIALIAIGCLFLFAGILAEPPKGEFTADMPLGSIIGKGTRSSGETVRVFGDKGDAYRIMKPISIVGGIGLIFAGILVPNLRRPNTSNMKNLTRNL